MRRLPALCLPLILALAACGGGRGLVFDDDGLGDNTPERARQRTLAWALADVQQTFPGLDATLATEDLPRWVAEGRRHDEGWYYDHLTLAVTLSALPSGIDADAIAARLRQRLGPSMWAGTENLVITTRVEPAAPATPATTVPPAAGTYVIQAGDTLAQISAAFYGTTQHWKRILAANPGLDPAGLQVGQTIAIPPAP